MRSNRDRILSRVGLLAAVLIGCSVFLAVHLYQLQVRDHDIYFAKAKARYTAVTTTSGKRGEVFDRNGNMLVGNKPCEVLVADPSLIPPEQCGALADILCSELPLDRETVLRKLNTRIRIVQRGNAPPREVAIRYAVIARHVDFAVAGRIREKVRALKPRLPHVAFFSEEEYVRYYPKGELLSNVLGFTSYSKGEDVPVSGVERSFNQSMVPSNGKIRYERSRDGSQLPYGMREITREEKDGMNIYLTIDEVLQSIVEEELGHLYEKFTPRVVCAIMADPKTGEILALAQRPSFDPNDRSREMMENKLSWRLLSMDSPFEPGSIMKALSISLAIDDGTVTPDTMIDAEGGVWFYCGKQLKDSSRRNVIPVWVGVQKSSNIVTAKIGLMMGERRVFDGLRSFGLGQKTGIPLQPESTGIFRMPKNDKLWVTRAPIGYGIGVTPMQMVRAYCALADGGRLRKLRLFHHAEDPATGEIIEPADEPPVQLFRRPDTAAKMTNMLKAVTKVGGTAKTAGVPGFEVAGKTGTSRKVINGHYAEGKYFSTFIGYVPADDPKFVLMITLDEPHGALYGGLTAGPTFRAISERALKYLNVAPDPALMPAPKGK
ncbi:MAG: penicillin-binding protein 2 [Victivallaceae bacterium]|nr:penicillin-binding protein 2 [Victivallaceae bacterium]